MKKQLNKDFNVRLEEQKDYFETENLVREAFWNVYRPGCSEHFVLHVLRDCPDFIGDLDFVMEKDGKLIGQVVFVKSHIDMGNGEKKEIATFGPISIAPEYKRQGYGSALLDYAMEKAAKLNVGALAICGNESFYGTLGFEKAKNFGILYEDDPTADYFLIKELKKGFLSGINGTYHDPQEYFVNDADVEEFDKKFPPKQKLKLPGQLF